jgi:hypothetical protein
LDTGFYAHAYTYTTLAKRGGGTVERPETTDTGGGGEGEEEERDALTQTQTKAICRTHARHIMKLEMARPKGAPPRAFDFPTFDFGVHVPCPFSLKKKFTSFFASACHLSGWKLSYF